MKIQTHLVFVLLFIPLTAFTQPCLPDGITFSNQEEIDNFQSNYPNCTEIGGDVLIAGDDITNLNGLNVLTSVDGSLIIGSYSAGGNPNLGSLSGLENLETIGIWFFVGYNNSLIDLSGMESLTSIGFFFGIEGNNALTSLSGIENLTYAKSLHIVQNNSLQSLAGIENVTIEQSINISNNNNLTSIVALENLTLIEGNLEIEGNPVLVNLTGLSNISVIDGSVDIRDNDSLINLEGLESLTSTGLLTLKDNLILESLTGIENLSAVNGPLWISNNQNLESLTALGNLTSVSVVLMIDSCFSLTSLSGIDNIEASTIMHLDILYNTSLSDCDVESICTYLAAPGGTVNIHDNAPGCNSQQEVQEACDEVIITESTLYKTFEISPNPVSSTMRIQFTIYDPDNYHDGVTLIELFEVSGVKVKSILNERKLPGTYELEIDVSDLNAGVYFCTIQTSQNYQLQKILKL